jgi:ABC-2 type transport system permease protein
MGGWNLQEMFFLFSLRLVAHGLFLVFFGNFQFLSAYVIEGDFDRFLLRPLNPLLHIVVAEYNPATLGDFTLGIVCFALSVQSIPIAWTPLAVLFLILVILGGAAVEIAIYLFINTFTFWIMNAQYLRHIMATFGDQAVLYPLTIFNRGLQFVLTFLVPVAFMGYYPASALLNRAGEVPFHPVLAYLTPLAGGVSLALAYAFWQAGLNRYQSTGS